MAKLYNLARMTTATTGTGTITLGSAVTGWLSFASAGVANADEVTYAIVDGNNREIGRGVYTSSGTTLTRSVLKSTNSNNPISLSGSATIFITAAAEDFSSGSGRFYSEPPLLSSFTWVNQGSASAEQVSGSGTPIMVTIPTAALNWRILTVSAPSTPYSVIAHLRSSVQNTNATGAGLYFYASGSGKLMGFETLYANNDTLRVEKMNSVTVDNSTVATSTILTTMTQGMWARLRNDGSTLYLDYSTDGYNFVTMFSESVGTFISPDNVGFGGACLNGSGPLRLSLNSWSIVNNATA